VNTGKTVAAATAAVPGVEDRKTVAPLADGVEDQGEGHSQDMVRGDHLGMVPVERAVGQKDALEEGQEGGHNLGAADQEVGHKG